MSVKMNEGFNYVVRKQEQQKICFGSGKSRDLSLKSGMNTFMRFQTRDDFSNISPAAYNTLESFKAITSKPCSKSISKKGYGGLARTALTLSHSEDYPAPNEYKIPSSIKKTPNNRYPFLSTAKRKIIDINKNPGPGTYTIASIPKRRIEFDHDFGHCVKMRLGVEIKCCKKNVDLCDICSEKPIGDYWHLDNRVFLCRPCMIKERRKPQKHKKDLTNFRKIRDCSWIHLHEGTDARVWLMHPGLIQKWTQREAYMCSFIKD